MTESGLKNINVFYSTFTNVFFLFLSRFFNVFYFFFWNVFLHLCIVTRRFSIFSPRLVFPVRLLTLDISELSPVRLVGSDSCTFIPCDVYTYYIRGESSLPCPLWSTSSSIF